MTTTMTTEQKVLNYQGNNQFLNSLKQSLTRYSSLTQRQREIAVRTLMSIERNGELVIENLSEDLQLIMKYTGSNDFILKMKDDYTKWRNLSERQIAAAVKSIKKEKTPTMEIRVDLKNESIRIKRGIALKIKEEYGLEFMPILVDLVGTTHISAKAVRVRAKLTKENGDVCRCCGAELTDEFSILTGMGPICAKNLRLKYIKDKVEAARFHEELALRIEEIGEFEFWLPKSQIKEYVQGGRFKFLAERFYN
jgi:hypothetical protein